MNVEEQNIEDVFREKIIESIEKKRPVISYGIVGPPDEGIVAGYDENGRILFGRSYFHDGSSGYYEKEDWYKDCLALLFVGDRKASPEDLHILLEALRWAVQLAHTRDCTILVNNNNKHLVGFAAFDAWIDALRNDAYFPGDDMGELTLACMIHKNVTLSGLLDSRRAAVGFLKSMIDEIQPGKDEIEKAISVYEEELKMLSKGMKMIPFGEEPEEKRRQIADPELRSNLADLILEVKEKEIRAVNYIKKAIDEMENL